MFDDLYAQLPGLRGKVRQLRTQEALIAAEAAAVDKVIEAVEALRDPSRRVLPGTKRPAGTGPRGMAAIRQLMLEQPERVWRPCEIQAALEERGWVSRRDGRPSQGADAALKGLMLKGEVDRISSGHYRYAANRGAPDARTG